METILSVNRRSICTRGCAAKNGAINLATCSRPNSNGAEIRTRPCAILPASPARLSASSMSCRMRRQCSKYCWPNSVSAMARVVLVSKRAPKRSSSVRSERLSAGSDLLIARAAPLRLPCSTIRTKCVMAVKRSSFMIVDSKVNRIIYITVIVNCRAIY